MGLIAQWLGILVDDTTLLLSRALALVPHTEDDVGQCPGGTLPLQCLPYLAAVKLISLDALSSRWLLCASPVGPTAPLLLPLLRPPAPCTFPSLLPVPQLLQGQGWDSFPLECPVLSPGAPSRCSTNTSQMNERVN